MTNPAHLSGPRHLDNFIVTSKSCPLTGTLQKRMPTLTRTATNQTAGPLAFTSELLVTRYNNIEKLTIK